MNDSIRLHRDRCKDESFLARADRGGVVMGNTQRLGILESRRGRFHLSLDYRDTLSASAYSLASRPMMAPDRRGELVSRLGHAGCGGNPHALNNRSVKPENDRAGKASRSADRWVNVNPSPSAVRGITDTAPLLSAWRNRLNAAGFMPTRVLTAYWPYKAAEDAGSSPAALTFSEESVQLRHSPQGRASWRLGCWCNRARRNNPPVTQLDRVPWF